MLFTADGRFMLSCSGLLRSTLGCDRHSIKEQDYIVRILELLFVLAMNFSHSDSSEGIGVWLHQEVQQIVSFSLWLGLYSMFQSLRASPQNQARFG